MSKENFMKIIFEVRDGGLIDPHTYTTPHLEWLQEDLRPHFRKPVTSWIMSEQAGQFNL